MEPRAGAGTGPHRTATDRTGPPAPARNGPHQGWQDRGVAGVAERQKVATPPGSRGAEKCRGRDGSLNFQSLWSGIELESHRDLIALARTVARATARLSDAERKAAAG